MLITEFVNKRESPRTSDNKDEVDDDDETTTTNQETKKMEKNESPAPKSSKKRDSGRDKAKKDKKKQSNDQWERQIREYVLLFHSIISQTNDISLLFHLSFITIPSLFQIHANGMAQIRNVL